MGELHSLFQIKEGHTLRWCDLCVLAYSSIRSRIFLLKSKKNLKGLNIFNHEFLCTAYANDTTFFLKNKNSVFDTLIFSISFYLVSGLSLNTTKCEIAGTDTLEGVNVAICGMKCLKLMKKLWKYLLYISPTIKI